jgi:hypothetical protein
MQKLIYFILVNGKSAPAIPQKIEEELEIFGVPVNEVHALSVPPGWDNTS